MEHFFLVFSTNFQPQMKSPSLSPFSQSFTHLGPLSFGVASIDAINLYYSTMPRYDKHRISYRFLHPLHFVNWCLHVLQKQNNLRNTTTLKQKMPFLFLNYLTFCSLHKRENNFKFLKCAESNTNHID